MRVKLAALTGLANVWKRLQIPIAIMTDELPLFPQFETFGGWLLGGAGAQKQKPRTLILGLVCGFSEFCVFPAGFSGNSPKLTQQ